MVLVIGHKFKLDVWESIVKMMAVGEVSSFEVKKEVNDKNILCMFEKKCGSQIYNFCSWFTVIHLFLKH
jgi:hypothetical protein